VRAVKLAIVVGSGLLLGLVIESTPSPGLEPKRRLPAGWAIVVDRVMRPRWLAVCRFGRGREIWGQFLEACPVVRIRDRCTASFRQPPIILGAPPTSVANSRSVGCCRSCSRQANVVEGLVDEDSDYEAESQARASPNIVAGLVCGGWQVHGMIGQSVNTSNPAVADRLSTLTGRGLSLLILVILTERLAGAAFPMAASGPVDAGWFVQRLNWQFVPEDGKAAKSDSSIRVVTTLVLALLTRNLGDRCCFGVPQAGFCSPQCGESDFRGMPPVVDGI